MRDTGPGQTESLTFDFKFRLRLCHPPFKVIQDRRNSPCSCSSCQNPTLFLRVDAHFCDFKRLCLQKPSAAPAEQRGEPARAFLLRTRRGRPGGPPSSLALTGVRSAVPVAPLAARKLLWSSLVLTRLTTTCVGGSVACALHSGLDSPRLLFLRRSSACCPRWRAPRPTARPARTPCAQRPCRPCLLLCWAGRAGRL